MSRRKRKSRDRKAQSSAALRRNGLNAFQRSDYDVAIGAWERVRNQTPKQMPAAALAEAYFRRALKRLYAEIPDGEAGLADMQRAVELVPRDPCYTYHLGLAAHRQGELDLAVRSYHILRHGNSEFAARAAYPMALALLQQGEDPSAHPVWSALSDEERAMLGKAHLFRRRPYRVLPGAPALWRGLAALDEGDREGSRALLNQVLEGEPGTLEEGVTHYYLGVLAAQDKEWEKAGRQWAAARALGLRSPWLEGNAGELFHRMAEERLQAQDVDGALEAALEAARHKPTDNRLSELIAQIYERKAYQAASEGHWEVALEHWRQATDAGGGCFRVAYNLALAYEHNEDFIAAGEAWREALRRRPRREDHPDAVSDEQVARLWRRAAEAYHKAGQFEEAANVYRQALKWNPDDLDTRMTLAEGLLNDGRLLAAQNELDRILERDPDHIPALLLRGEVTAASERWWYNSAAPGYWERVLELEPRNADARQHLVDFYHEQAEDYTSWGNYQGAIAVYEKALRYAPQNAHLLAALGGCYLRIGDQPEAVSYIERAQSTDPTDLDAFQEIIHAWLDLGDAERAWEAVAQAEAAVGDIPFVFYVTLAALCIEADQDDLARPFLDRAVEKAPPDEPVLNMIGEMAMMSGAPDIAREYLEQAIRTGSRKGQAHLVLGVLSATVDHDLEEAERYWREADKIARRERDSGLRERIEMARMTFRAHRGLLDLLMGAPFFPGDLDLDDLGFSDEEEDDDEF